MAVMLQEFVDARRTPSRAGGTHRSVARLRTALSPECRASLGAHGWPGLALVLDGSDADVDDREALCALAPVDAVPRLLDMLARTDKLPFCEVRGACGATLARNDPQQWPALLNSVLALEPYEGGWRVPCPVPSFARGLPPADHDRLVPLLEESTRKRAKGRDELHEILCPEERSGHAPDARLSAACASSGGKEAAWRGRERWRSALLTALPFLVLELAYAIAVLALRRKLQSPEFPAGSLAAVGGAMGAMGLSAMILLGQTGDAGPLGGVALWVFMSSALPVTLLGWFAGLTAVRWGKLPPAFVGLVGASAAVIGTISSCYRLA